MKELKGACLFGQSGGPTSVINSSAAGVFLEALESDLITDIYAAEHGIKGILDERFFDIRKEDIEELKLLKNTPGSAFGTVRYKLKPVNIDDSDYRKIYEVFKKYNIRYFFYNGGNDSMDTCNKISKYLQLADYECRIIGIPKTIDNDLYGTDHCPGFGSAAKYVATTVMELYHDTIVYNTGLVTIVEVMGRNAGWLTAASALASLKGCGPDLIYLPEIPFDVDKFVNDVIEVAKRKNNKVLVVLSEGIKDLDGKYISEYLVSLNKDSFGHAQLGGVATILAGIISDNFNVKVRPIEFSLLQRCAAHLASEVDVEEAFMAGKMAVKYALEGQTDKMVVFTRDKNSKEYKINYDLLEVHAAANVEKKIPLEWIDEENFTLKQEFFDYIMPLIQGESKAPLVDGLPRFAKLNKVLVKAK